MSTAFLRNYPTDFRQFIQVKVDRWFSLGSCGNKWICKETNRTFYCLDAPRYWCCVNTWNHTRSVSLICQTMHVRMRKLKYIGGFITALFTYNSQLRTPYMLEFLTRLLLVSVCLNVVLKVSGLYYIFITHTTGISYR